MGKESEKSQQKSPNILSYSIWVFMLDEKLALPFALKENHAATATAGGLNWFALPKLQKPNSPTHAYFVTFFFLITRKVLFFSSNVLLGEIFITFNANVL